MASEYEKLGVSADKAAVHAAIAELDKGLFPGAFCQLYPDIWTGSPKHCILMHTDGTGSKAGASYLACHEGYWSQTLLNHLTQDAVIMNIDDAACAGALGPFYLSNNLSRNSFRIPDEWLGQIIKGYKRICQILTENHIGCYMAGGETADLSDNNRTLEINCTIVGRMRRDEVIDCSRMCAGDLIVGFSSTGQAEWEDSPNSGIGSNGLTVARHKLLSSEYREKYPETYAPELKLEQVYQGQHKFDRTPHPDLGMEFGEALLSPTRTYAPMVKRLLDRLPREQIHGLIHCTGGGQTKIRKFGGPELRFHKDNPFPIPPLFRLIKEAGNISWKEMYKDFNMGWLMEAVVPNKQAADVCIEVARKCNIDAQIVGYVRVEAHITENRVCIKDPDSENMMYYHTP